MSFRGVELIARGDETANNPFQRIASVKSFFYPFRLVRWASYAGIDPGRLAEVLKTIESPFAIPKALAGAVVLLSPNKRTWRKVKAGIDLVGAGSRSLVWANRQFAVYGDRTFLGPGSCEILEKTSTLGKLLSASWVVANSAAHLVVLADKKPQSKWEAKELWRKTVSYGLSLAKGVIKLLAAIGVALAVFGGLSVSPFLLLGLYTIALAITLGKRFFEREKSPSPYLKWERLRWE